MSEPPIHVLLVCDRVASRETARTLLQRNGIELNIVSIANDTCRLSDIVQTMHPFIVVLDLTAPIVQTIGALHVLRGSGAVVQVLMLTSGASETGRVAEVELGDDDYLGQALTPEELLASIRAVLRHARAPALPAIFRFGPFTLDVAAHTLLRHDTPVRLTQGDYALLVAFTQHPMEALTRKRLVQLLHGPQSDVTERGIDVPVWRLRRLLEENPAVPRRIQTVRGVGYRFVPEIV